MSQGPLRVLEVSGGIAGAYCGWLLAAMGAEVHRVDVAPLATDAHLLRALRHLNAGKATLGQARLAANPADRLAEADILITDDSQALEHLVGSEIERLARAHPQLIIGIVSVFGRTGPLADAPASELDAQAASSVAWVLGEPGRPPLTVPPEILAAQSGAHLAAACLAARSLPADENVARIVDIALADVLVSYVGVNCRFYVHHGMHWRRSGRRASDSGGAYPFVILPCADGQVCLSGRTKSEWLRLVEALGNPAWAAEPRYQSLRRMGRDYPEEVDALIAPVFAAMTKAEVAEMAYRHRLTISPVRSFAEVLETPQFEARGFWRELPHGGRTLRAPGLPFRTLERRDVDAPSISESLLALRPDRGGTEPATGGVGAGAQASGISAQRPLAGLRIVDLGWVWSAPQVSGLLAQLGADVIKVEHRGRIDSMRLSGPVIRDGEVVEGDPIDMSPMFHQINLCKRGITLNLKEPRAVELLAELIDGADIVVENMSPESLERIGLGYETLRQRNPRLVMLSMTGAGQFGPLAQMRTYAPVMSSFVGLEALVGYQDEEPIGALNFALGDPNSAVHGLAALFAALIRRQATGHGCYIDLSQTEALLATLAPFVLSAQADGAQPTPRGNAHAPHAPYGIYPTAGADGWISLAVCSDEQWAALLASIAPEDWRRDPELDRGSVRFARRGAVDALVSSWTARHGADELEHRLRRVGVPAARVVDIDGLWAHPQFRARGLFDAVPLPELGVVPMVRVPWCVSDFEPPPTVAGPRLGEHNDQVFTEVLGLQRDEVEALKAGGVIA